MQRLFAFILICLLTGPAIAAVPNEMVVRRGVRNEASTAFRLHDFAQLNELEKRYRSLDDKTPSGGAFLTYFYDGLEDYAHSLTPIHTDSVIDPQWAKVIALVQEWIARAPSPAAYITLAILQNDWAWAIRGEDSAENVRSQDWLPFHAKTEETRRSLEKYKEAASVDPEWYATSLLLMRNEPYTNATRIRLVKEAIARHPYYRPIYFAAAANLEPKWNGSWDALDDFAQNTAVKATQQKLGKSIYASIYISTQRGCNCLAITGTRANWVVAKVGLDDLIKRYPSQYNIGYLAYFSCQARDLAVSRQAFLHLSGFDSNVWDGGLSDYNLCRRWALSSK